MTILGSKKIDSVLIEGGGEINAGALKSGIVNKFCLYIAPKLIGADGKNSIAPLGINLVNDAVKLKNPQITNFDFRTILQSAKVTSSHTLCHYVSSEDISVN